MQMLYRECGEKVSKTGLACYKKNQDDIDRDNNGRGYDNKNNTQTEIKINVLLHKEGVS